MNQQPDNGRITQAITCQPGKNILTLNGPSVGIPDLDRARLQHRNYCDALEKCGVRVALLPSESAVAQAAAVVTDYLAVLGGLNGHREIASTLAGTRHLKFVTPPGRIDGRDVLRIENHFFIGISDTTNEEGAAQLAFYLHEYGYHASVLDLDRSLHLGASAVYLGENRLLVREELSRHYSFLPYEKIVVSAQERRAANAQMVNGTLIMPAGYTLTPSAVRAAGITVIEVNVSEFEKVNTGINCLALTLSENRKAEKIELPLRAETRRAASA